MKPDTSNKNKDLAFPGMAMDILSNVLSRADNPGDLGKYLTEEVRDLTGARCVLLIQCLSTPTVLAHSVVSVNPLRRREWAESPDGNRLYEVVHHLSTAQLWRGEEPLEMAGFLRQEGFELSMVFPLNAGEFRVGAMLVLGLPDEEHITSVLSLLNNLSAIVALVFRNSILFEKQEQLIQERTAELHENNAQLAMELTERKKVEESLRNAYEYTQQLISSANMMIVGLDIAGHVRIFNHAAEKTTGYTIEELSGINWFEKIVPKNRYAYVWDTFQNYQQKTGSMPTTFENPILTKSGEERFISWQNSTISTPGAEISTISFGVDITERKMAEKALRQSEERFRRLAENAQDVIYRMSLPNGRYEYVSPASLSVFGYSPEEFYENPLLIKQVIHPDWHDYFEEQWANLIKGKMPPTYEYQFIHKSGEIRWLNQRNILVRDNAENPIAIEGIVTDITERKYAEQKVIKLAAIVESSENAIIGKSLDGIISSWNNGAEKIYGYTESEVIGKSVSILHPPDRVNEMSQILEKIKSGEHIVHYETMRRRKDGKDIHVALTVSPIRDTEGGIVAASTIGSDITGRKEAEEALHTASLYARSLIEASLDPLVTISSDGKITDVNHATESVTGVTRHRLINSDFSDYFTEPEKARAGYQQVLAQGLVRDYALTIRHASGKTTDVLYNATVYKNESGELQGVFAAARDITERKQVEEELAKYREHLEALVVERTKQLQESEFYYRRLFETMFQGVVYQDAKGKVISMNPAAELILGKTQSAFLGKTYVNTNNQIFKEDGSLFSGEEHPAMLALKTGHEVQNVVMKLYNPRVKEYRWINISAMPLFHKNEAKPYQVYTLFNDITERKDAEEALRVSEEQMRLFFERQLVGMAITSPEKGWVKVNDKICEMLGYSREEITQMTWSEMTYPEDLAPDVEQFEHLLHGEIDGYSLEKRFVCKDGSIVFTNLLVGCVRRPDRSVDYVLAILENITGRKQAEEQIQQLNEQLTARAQSLEQANKELEAFSYSVSHDLRAPLRGIDGFSLALLEDYQDKIDSQGKDYLVRVRTAAQRMAQLIDDILNLSRVSRSEMNIQQVNLSKMFREIVDNLYSTQSQREVEFIIQEGIYANGDSRLLRIVLENLIGNAWKFTAKHPTARIEFGIQQQKELPVYFIRDDGAGFDMNYVYKLFGAFQRLHTTDEFSGTGVGLATVQRVIHRHRGIIWAEGEVEKGATFYFTLP